MELNLEGIIETLLVGAMGSLLVLSVIFFAFGHIWNVRLLRDFFDTLFGERLTAAEPKPPIGSEDRSEDSRSIAVTQHGTRRPKVESGEDHMNFGLLLLLALLYGLGVIAEAASHHYLHQDNVDQKHRAFYDVASGKLKSGTASPRLARFVSDYDACRVLPRNGVKKEDPMSLCHQIDERVTQFFYNAKNVVFQHREYYEELSVLEARIGFMLSFQWLSRLLFFELCGVCVIAFIAELGWRNKRGLWRSLMDWIFTGKGRSSVEAKPAQADESKGHHPQGRSKGRTWREEWKQGAIGLGDHWVGIAAFHILLLLGACGGLYELSKYGCAYSEDQFAKRVFGYYLALASEHQGAKENGEGEHLDAPVDLTPESPYHMFSLVPPPRGGPVAVEIDKGAPSGGAASKEAHGAHKQRRLEPSAVQILGNTSQVLVASDQGGDEPFWLFTLNEDATQMTHPRALHVEDESDKDKLRAAGTIESLAAFEAVKKATPLPESKVCSAEGEQKAFRVFAGPSTIGPGPAHLLSFCLTIDPSLQEQASTEIKGIETQELPSPCKNLLGTDTCAIEGIAFRTNRHGQPELLLGVQKAGESATVVIVRMAWEKDRWSHPEQIFPARDNKCAVNANIAAMTKPGSGISDLAAAPSGRVYVTTSVQGDASASDKSGPVANPQVGGALWLLDLGCDADQAGDPCHCADQKATLLETFIHKPDGVSHDNGSVLVVFDDEARRKSRQWAPKTFPLAQDEAVFAIVPSPEFR